MRLYTHRIVLNDVIEEVGTMVNLKTFVPQIQTTDGNSIKSVLKL